MLNRGITHDMNVVIFFSLESCSVFCLFQGGNHQHRQSSGSPMAVRGRGTKGDQCEVQDDLQG